MIDSDAYLELTNDLERDKGIIERGPNHPLIRRVSCICGYARIHTTSAYGLGLHEASFSKVEAK